LSTQIGFEVFMHIRLIVSVVLVCALVAACGGGEGGDGGDSPTAPTASPPPAPPVDAPSIEDVLITGSVRVGSLAIATPMNYQQAQWAAPGAHQYHWEQRPAGSGDWAPIPDATGSRFVLPPALEGASIRCGIIPMSAGLNTPGAMVYSAPVGPVAPDAPASLPAWWPTSSDPTAGWGGEAQPRSVAPTKPGKGPHPVGYSTYVEMLITENRTVDIDRHRTRVNEWIPGIGTGEESFNDPTRALSLTICHALAEAGAIATPTAAECIAKAEAYFNLSSANYEQTGTNAFDWINRSHESNWPSGGITVGGLSMQTQAVLYGYFKDLVSSAARTRAEEHAAWWIEEVRKFRLEWSYEALANDFPHGSSHGQGFHEKSTEKGFLWGAVWLLIEFYDPTSPTWQDQADFYGDFVYRKYLPWMQWYFFSDPAHGRDTQNDGASGNSVDYNREWYSYHLCLCMVLETATGQDHWTGYDDATHSFLGKYLYTALYRTIPNSQMTGINWNLGPGWNWSQMRQAKFPVQLEHLMRFNYIRMDDPQNNSLVATHQEAMVTDPLVTYEGSLTYSGGVSIIPWWYFRNPAPVVTDYETLPLTKRFPSASHTVCRTAWSEGPESSWISFRSGEVVGHHSKIFPGDICWYHRGWALPRTECYEMSFRSAHMASATYNGIHIFDPADPSRGAFFNFKIDEVEVPTETLRDGGPKRIFDPWTYDTGHSEIPLLANLAPDAVVWDRYEMDQIRHLPESNHDMEQCRSRHISTGTANGVSYRAESNDWTPMFRKWPFEYNYNANTLAGPSYPPGDKRYHATARTTRVNHPNGYVRTIVWLDPGGGSTTSPPALIVYDQVSLVDAQHPVELWWCAVNEPAHVAANHYTFTDQRSVTNAIGWAWEPTYYSGGQYHHDCILHLQLFNGDSSLEATTASDVYVHGGPKSSGGESENHVIEDGLLSANPPIDKTETRSLGYNNAQYPWDPNYGPMELARYQLKIAPAPTWSTAKRFLTVMNTDVNGAGIGAYPATVTEAPGEVQVQVDFPTKSCTVTIDTISFSVTVQ
jgi:hypothetical protein